VGTPPLLARALGLYAAKLDFQGVTPSEEYWRRALALEASTGELRIDGPTNARGGVLAFLEDDRDAGKALMEAVADSMRRRSDPLLPIQLHRIANVARNAGAWDEADRYIEEASELVAQTGLDSYVPSLLIDAGRMAMLRGDFERARSTIEDGLRLLEKLRSDTPGAAGEGAAEEALAHSVVARMLLQSGQYAEAHAELAHVLDHIRERTYTFPLPEPLADNVICLTALGRLDEAEGELDELYGLADTLARPWWDALAARGGAVVATARGETAAALAEFQRAVELLESMRSPWPYELGRTLFMQGAAQRRARQKVAARATLQRALEIFEGLGANLWVEKTHTELRQIGGRLSRPDALTESERQIAELVALGRSNAAVARELSLSPKTVEWNLSKIYKKLHVSSRTELAAKLAHLTMSP
jgi:ATP/maltotriose-dependent transcriptional regulator MalT